MDFSCLDTLQSVSLDQISDAGLMNRIDTKYVTHISCLENLIGLAARHYKILEIGSVRRLPYYTCYYDTDNLEMYHEHQRGRKCRQKIRIRKYEGNNERTFLEIKNKNNRGRTKKKRVPVESSESIAQHSDFISEFSRYELMNLSPQIENHFYRITLVRNDMSERITIDTALEFHNLKTGIYAELPFIVIIEWKRKKLSADSPMKHILKSLGIRESGFSKYCVGMAHTNCRLKQNRFKNKLRTLTRLQAS